MRTSLALRAALVGSSALLLLAPLTATTLAPVAGAAPVDNQLSAQQLPPELSDAITRDLKISPAEYLQRANAAQQLGTYARDFRSQHPSEFAGAWLGQDGHPIVAVTSTEAAQKATRDGYQTRIAPISADGLENSLAQMNRWIAGQPREVSSQVNSVAIDVLNSQIVVDVANSPVGRALNLPTLIANVKVMLSPGGGGPIDRHPMGGDSYVTAKGPLAQTPPSQIDVCSFGFNSVDDAGNPLNVSAGHCDPNVGTSASGAAVYVPNVRAVQDSPQAGNFVSSTLGAPENGLDYSVIKLNKAAVRNGLDRPIVRGANGTTLSITGTADPVTGAPVCKAGQTSAFTCGYVAADKVETQLFTADGASRVVRGFASTACTLAGDSGGAIVSGTLALGITSGSNSSSSTDCSQANLMLAPDGGTASLGIPIKSIVADAASHSSSAGLRIRTAPIAG